MMFHPWRTIAAAVIAAALPEQAFGGAMNIDCRRPFVFSKAAVNVVVLPYTYAGDSPRIDATSRQLSLLTQLDALFGIVKFGSVGAVQHVHVSTAPAAIAECSADIVVNKLLGRTPGAAAHVQPGHGVVVLWGRFYEERGSIYAQSYIRFLRRDVPEEGFTFAIDGQRFGGRISANSFAFTPRLFSRDDLRRITDRFSTAVKLHVSPTAQSPAVNMALGGDRPFTYWVEDVAGSWMRLNANGNGPNGWVQADMPMDDWSLRQRLPELTFVEGVVGYLSTRVTRANPTSLNARRARAVAALQRALDHFAAGDGGRSQTLLPDAVGRQLLGLLALPPEAPVTALDDAVKAFADALERVPNDADARNLTATARLQRALAGSAPVARPEGYVDEYLSISTLDPRNGQVLGNLESLLELLSREGGANKRFGATALAAGDIQKRLTAVRAVRKSLAAPGAGL